MIRSRGHWHNSGGWTGKRRRIMVKREEANELHKWEMGRGNINRIYLIN
jgi:hypothetical protein